MIDEIIAKLIANILLAIVYLVIINVASNFLSPWFMFFFQRKRNRLFSNVADKYGFTFNKEKLSFFHFVDKGDKNPFARSIEGERAGKKVVIQDTYFFLWSGLGWRWRIKYGYPPLRGPISGIKTELIVNGIRNDIGVWLTGYASKERIVAEIESLK